MTNSQLRYRGIPYDASQHEHPSSEAVEHTYRGRHYLAPLRHEPAPVDTSRELHYRGAVYHHRANAA
ncbi:DUF4278 domain-containing protein [Cyanobium sp. NIES-981]|uniref:DUF4278 domain-containing protein n=1 Tax=Cyanobium sp. NIES-981 TaxID=1851505 RepID=UPI0007DCBBD7|nr:DUF4278 domain-containing protein [Cyanobium sp. NIES-981]SBO41890.1 putative Extracellular link domain [Cyanobium sp. NIES-981]